MVSLINLPTSNGIVHVLDVLVIEHVLKAKCSNGGQSVKSCRYMGVNGRARKRIKPLKRSSSSDIVRSNWDGKEAKYQAWNGKVWFNNN